jgi:hypothetical protein
VDTTATLKHLVESAGLSAPLTAELLKQTTAEVMAEALAAAEPTEASRKLSPMLQSIAEHNVAYFVYNQILCDRTPKFLYFDEYYQMKGQDNIEALKQRVANGELEESDHPLLGLIELARLDLDQLTDPKRTEALLAKLEAAENQLTGKAQADLLRYFEEELKPHHQLIYTTHSPFMVDPTHFDRVRIVQDLSIEPNSDDLPGERQGTQVITEVLDATPDSLFPLQGALGYEIYQTLFIGPNSLVVEGMSDLLYI